jgi:ABC-type transporter Mla subunit MlaD
MRIMDKGRPIDTDSTAKIRPRLFLEGNFFVDIKPGLSGHEIASGGRIPLTQTAVPVQFDQMLSTFDESGRADLQTFLKQFASGLDGSGARGLNHAFGDAPQGLRGLAQTMTAFRGVEPDDLVNLVRNTSAASSALNADRTALAGLIRGLDGTLTALGSRSTQFADALDDAAQLFERLPELNREAQLLAPPVERLTAALAPALAQLPSTLRPTNALLREAQPLLAPDQLPRLARDLRPALQDLSALTPGLRRAFVQIQPVAACLRDNVIPVLNSKIDDGKLSTGLKAWEELLRFPVGLAGSSGAFNGNGHGVRLSAGGSEQAVALNEPSLGDLIQTSANPVAGASPRYTPGHQPPFSPTTDCRTQAVPSLATEIVPAARTSPIPQARKDALNARVARAAAKYEARR